MFRYVEHLIPFLRKHDSFVEANHHLWNEIIWPHFWLIQMWLVVLFFLYATIRELVRAIGKEEILRMFLGMQGQSN